jgi:exonuclease SbcC
MQLRRLLMRNVLAVGDQPVEIEFPQGPGITHIKGINLDVTAKSSNGAGKSNIIEGILIGLYGRTLRKEHGKSLTFEAMVHGEDSDGYVEIEYDDTKIVRTFNTKKQSVSYTIKGIPQSTDASAVQVKKDLAEHININFETMCNILLFGQHNMFSFLESGEPEKREIVENLMNLKEYNLYEERARELRKETKKKIEILVEANKQTDLFLSSQNQLLEEHKQSAVEYKRNVQNKIEQLKSQLNGLVDADSLRKQWEEYDSATLKSNKIADSRKDYSKRILQLLEELGKFAAEKDEELKGKTPFVEAVIECEKEILGLEEKKRGLLDKVVELSRQAEAHRLAISEIELRSFKMIDDIRKNKELQKAEEELHEVTRKGKEIRQNIEAVSNKKLTAGVICPTCYGKIDPSNAQGYILHMNSELETLRTKYTACNSKVEEVKSKIDLAVSVVEKTDEAEINALKEKRQSALKKSKDFNDQIEAQFKKRMEQLKKGRDEAKSQADAFEKEILDRYASKCQGLLTEKQDLKAKCDTLDNELRSLRIIKPAVALADIGAAEAKRESINAEIIKQTAELDKNPYSEMMVSIQKSVNEINSKCEVEKVEIRKTEELLPYYDFWAGAMGKEGIKSFIVEGILPALNQQIEYWMQIIYQGTISVKFDKYLNVEITNNTSNRGLKRYGQGSGGERRRIDLAIMLAFRQIMKMSSGKDPSVVFFDEPIENLDEEGVRFFYDVVLDISKVCRVYVITHNPTLVSLLESHDTILVEKSGGSMRVQ